MAKADFIEKRTEKESKTPDKITEGQAAESNQMVLFGSDDSLSGKQPPGNTELSMYVEIISRSWVMNYCLPARISNVGTNEKYE